jgi:hypothetical protein
MLRSASISVLLIAGLVIATPSSDCPAGMPAVLPTNWTASGPRPDWARSTQAADSGAAQFQAISFFLACLLVSAWGLKALWNSIGRDFPALPRLRYGRALSLVILWGLCFIVVLTMISGARELMTPGAWKKQGWTYTLAESKPADTNAVRREALENLRFELWNYAAAHDGKFPSEGDPGIDADRWDIPGWAGLRFLYVGGQSVSQSGRLLVFEPALNDEERLVLMTNGFLGSMRTSEIERQLEGVAAP